MTRPPAIIIRPQTLIECATTAAGSRTDIEACLTHRRHATWGSQVPLWALEYRAVFPEGALGFENTVADMLASSSWLTKDWRLCLAATSRTASRKAAQRILECMAQVTAEAASQVQTLGALRSRITDDLHILRVQVLTRAEAVLQQEIWRGVRVLEVGCQDGGLSRWLVAQGATVTAVDPFPTFQAPWLIQGDFQRLTWKDPFDVLLATAVFENGSGWHLPTGGAEVLLQLLWRAVKPGGIVALENVALPLPFSPDEAVAAGFEVLDLRIPGPNLLRGGRGCTLRKSA